MRSSEPQDSGKRCEHEALCHELAIELAGTRPKRTANSRCRVSRTHQQEARDVHACDQYQENRPTQQNQQNGSDVSDE